MLFDMKSYRKSLLPIWKYKKLLRGQEPYKDDMAHEIDAMHDKPIWPYVYLFVILFLLSMLLINGCAYGYTLNQYADAIYKAENSKSHPYGIMTTYKHITARQACINTVKHSALRWAKTDRKVPFVTFLQKTYCPIGSNTDNGTCRYWACNVNMFLERG